MEREYQPIADAMTLTTYAIIDNTSHQLIPGVPSSLLLSPPEGTQESAAVTSPGFDTENSHLGQSNLGGPGISNQVLQKTPKLGSRYSFHAYPSFVIFLNSCTMSKCGRT